jgi:hypothetical protein
VVITGVTAASGGVDGVVTVRQVCRRNIIKASVAAAAGSLCVCVGLVNTGDVGTQVVSVGINWRAGESLSAEECLMMLFIHCVKKNGDENLFQTIFDMFPWQPGHFLMKL